MTLRLNGAGSGFTEIKAADTAGDNSIKLPASNGSANQLLQNGGTAGELQYTSAGEGLHYDSSGRLLVGNTTPGAMNGGTIVAGDASAPGGAVALAVKYTSADTLNTFGSMYSSASTLIGYGVRSSNSASDTFISTADLSALKRGALVVGGELVYSSAGAQATTIGSEVTLSERMRITPAGQLRLAGAGITFNGDSATVNELDDYEHGVYNTTIPAITATTNAVNMYYVKVGNLVNIVGVITLAGISANNGTNANFVIPFTPTGYSTSVPGGNIQQNTINTSVKYIGYYAANNVVYFNTESGAYTNAGSLGNGKIGFTMTYTTFP